MCDNAQTNRYEVRAIAFIICAIAPGIRPVSALDAYLRYLLIVMKNLTPYLPYS